LYRYFDTSGRPHNITTRDITAALRRAAAAVYHITNIPPERIEAYSLRSGGATALLVSGIDQTAIRALGRWKSDSIFLYLRTQPSRLTSAYSRAMLDHGQYTFSPSAETYADKDLLPRETPPYLTSTLQAAENVDLNIPPSLRLRLSHPLSPTLGTYMGYTAMGGHGLLVKRPCRHSP
jgi:hypothetical protein